MCPIFSCDQHDEHVTTYDCQLLNCLSLFVFFACNCYYCKRTVIMIPCDLDILPICFVVILVVSLATSFTIAVYDSDITPWFPAISDTATETPESNIFGQLVNIASFIGLIVVYVRYLQVKRDLEQVHGSRRATVILNRCSLFFGLTAILGSSIVANFPVRN